MSTPREPSPALLFTAILYSGSLSTSELLSYMYENFGSTIFESIPMKFVWSDYYEQEMGKDLKRIFLVYAKPIQRTELPDFKKKADELEVFFTKDGKRTVNIDPGLICEENIELATNKGFSHRIYLRDGVYADLTLFYKKNSYQPIEYWTYPEYRSTPVLSFFNTARVFLN